MSCSRTSVWRVGVLAYEGCFAAEVFGVSDLLVMADAVAERGGSTRPLFRVSVLGRSPVVRAAGGHRIHAEPLETVVDRLVVPGFQLDDGHRVDRHLDRLGAEIAAIRRVADGGTPVASVCVGAFLLGHAGVLARRRVTTSWLFADHLQARHPDARVDRDAMAVTDGSVTTTAAFSAVHDLALQFVRQRGGDTLARQVASLALVADDRHSQAPYVDHGLFAPGADRLVGDAQRWLVEHLAEPYDLSRLASVFHVSPRTMLRRFSRATGRSPRAYLQHTRIEAAKRLLESPEHSVATAMERVGYRDLTSFRRLFVSRTGLSPSAYRRSAAACSTHDSTEFADGETTMDPSP